MIAAATLRRHPATKFGGGFNVSDELTCDGISPTDGEIAASDIEQEFREHRQWHHDVSCRFENGLLVLTARNDFDDTGMALLDEFGDCLSAYLAEHGEVRLRRVEAV